MEEVAGIDDLDLRACAIVLNDLHGHEDERIAELIRSVKDAGMTGPLVKAMLQPPMPAITMRPWWWRPVTIRRPVKAGNLFEAFGIDIAAGGGTRG